MAENLPRPENDDAAQPSLGHQPDRVSIRGILWTGAGVVLLVMIAVVGMWGMFAWVAPRVKIAERVGLRPTRPDTISEPALDPHQPAELRALRENEEALLSSYGWIDAERGIAHVPIDRAMRMFAGTSRLPGGTSDESSDSQRDEAATDESDSEAGSSRRPVSPRQPTSRDRGPFRQNGPTGTSRVPGGTSGADSDSQRDEAAP